MNVCLYVCMHVCMYACMYLCMYVCNVCVYVYMYSYSRTLCMYYTLSACSRMSLADCVTDLSPWFHIPAGSEQRAPAYLGLRPVQFLQQ